MSQHLKHVLLLQLARDAVVSEASQVAAWWAVVHELDAVAGRDIPKNLPGVVNEVGDGGRGRRHALVGAGEAAPPIFLPVCRRGARS